MVEPEHTALSFALGLLAVALLLIGAIVWRLRSAGRSLHWPRVAATIVESRTARGAQHKLVPHLRYRYEVDGRAFESDRIGLGWRATVTDSHTQALVDRHPVGLQVFAFHDPKAPGRAVLQTGAGLGIWLQVMVLGVLASQALLAGVVLLRAT